MASPTSGTDPGCMPFTLRSPTTIAEPASAATTAAPMTPADRVSRDRTIESALRQQRPVICAVDDDGHGPAVLCAAAVLAAQLAVPLTVVHSPSPDVYLVGEPRRAALARGNAFVDDIARGHAVDERVVELNDPVRLVTDVADEGATMIVIGTRRRTGFRAALLGSVSQSVVAGAGCPVLIVPPAELEDAGPAAATNASLAAS